VKKKVKVYDKRSYLIIDDKVKEKVRRAEEKSHRCGGCLRNRFDKKLGECLSCGFTWDGHKPRGTRSKLVTFEFPHRGFPGTTLLAPQTAKTLFDIGKKKYCSLVYVNIEVPPENYSNYQEFLEYIEDAITKEIARVRHEDEIRYCAVCGKSASIYRSHIDLDESCNIIKAVYLCDSHHKKATKLRKTPELQHISIDDIVKRLKKRISK